MLCLISRILDRGEGGKITAFNSLPYPLITDSPLPLFSKVDSRYCCDRLLSFCKGLYFWLLNHNSPFHIFLSCSLFAFSPDRKDLHPFHLQRTPNSDAIWPGSVYKTRAISLGRGSTCHTHS